MSLQLFLFDCDGTLVDSQHDIVAAMDHAFKSNGLEPPSRARTLSIVGLSVPEAIHALAPDLDEARRRSVTDAFRHGGPLRDGGGKRDLLYPGALEAITALASHENALLGVATGKSRRGVARLFDRYDWHPHFSTIQTADTNPSKPHPAMIHTAMAETGTEPAATTMIGDTTFDMAMARSAGVRAIGVSWGYHPAKDLEDAGAQAIVHDFAELLTLLQHSDV